MKLLFTIFLIFYLNQINIQANEYNAKETEMFKNLRCLICQGQSIADSNSEFAQTIKLVVKDQMIQGKSDKDIYKFLISKYGEWIVYKPSFNKTSYFLWLVPYFILVLGGIIIFIIIKKSKNN
mgnify:CR=1 FL=1